MLQSLADLFGAASASVRVDSVDFSHQVIKQENCHLQIVTSHAVFGSIQHMAGMGSSNTSGRNQPKTIFKVATYGV